MRPAREEKEEVGDNVTTARTTSKSSLIIRICPEIFSNKRQHPKRLKSFFDWLNLAGKLEEQAAEYLTLAGYCNDLP